MSKKVSNISLYNHITIALLLFFLPVSTITTMSSNCASVGDIVCVSPRSHNGKMMVTGHATVVSSIEQKTNYTLLNCYNGCKFDPLTLSLVIKTSNLH